VASIEQQNLLIDHLNRLNQWLTGDQQDRQAELGGVCARVDQLRDDLNRLFQGELVDCVVVFLEVSYKYLRARPSSAGRHA
jgi:hypothetical protein